MNKDLSKYGVWGLKGPSDANVKPLPRRSAKTEQEPTPVQNEQPTPTYNTTYSAKQIEVNDYDVQQRMITTRAPKRVLYQIKLTEDLDNALKKFVKDTGAKSRTAVIESVLRSFLKM